MAAERRSGKLLIFGLVIIALTALWLITRAASAPRAETPGADNAQRVSFIRSFGWETTPVPTAVEEIRIPARFDEAYEQYNALQKEQGFDLRKYSAAFAHKYTYRITNYEGADPIVPINVNLIVVDGKIVGADISSAEANGFVTVLVKK